MAAPSPLHHTTISKPPSNTTDASRRRATRTAFLLALAWTLFAPLTVAAAGLREDRPNLAGGEVLGRGLGVTLNYERFLTNRIGLGGGIIALKGQRGRMAGIIPLYASLLTGDRHSLYLSGGGAILLNTTPIQDLYEGWILQGSAGYHFQSRGGFFVRPLITLNFATVEGSRGFLPWPGVTLGGSF